MKHHNPEPRRLHLRTFQLWGFTERSHQWRRRIRTIWACCRWKVVIGELMPISMAAFSEMSQKKTSSARSSLLLVRTCRLTKYGAELADLLLMWQASFFNPKITSGGKAVNVHCNDRRTSKFHIPERLGVMSRWGRLPQETCNHSKKTRRTNQEGPFQLFLLSYALMESYLLELLA